MHGDQIEIIPLEGESVGNFLNFKGEQQKLNKLP